MWEFLKNATNTCFFADTATFVAAHAGMLEGQPQRTPHHAAGQENVSTAAPDVQPGRLRLQPHFQPTPETWRHVYPTLLLLQTEHIAEPWPPWY